MTARYEIDGEGVRNVALTVLLVVETWTLFIAAPLAAMGIRSPLFIGVLSGIPLIVAIVVISDSMWARLLGVLATALAIAGTAFRIDHPSLASVWLGPLGALAAFLAITLIVGKAVFASGQITYHRLAGAVILYFNIGVVFTSVYRLISELDAAAFSNFPAHQAEAVAVSSMLYFSFTTLTSTGFGDILPVNPVARSMTNLESILGQLYLAILLARLVTMHVETRRH